MPHGSTSVATGGTPLAVFGARSYTAGELLRLLCFHPIIKPGFLVSKSATGAGIAELQPQLKGWHLGAKSGDEAAAFEWLAEHPKAVIALCTGSHESAGIVARLEAAKLLEGRVLVDLSGDFRLKDAASYHRWYGQEHPCPHVLKSFDYCIPELHRSTSHSHLIANPGCFATAVQLALAPALNSKLVETAHIHVFAVTGSSGSGATPKPNTHHPFRAHEFYAYKPLTHQHTPEILAGLGLSDEAGLSLVTHSAPLVRGISVTASLSLRPGVSAAAFTDAYRFFAASEPMLRYTDAPPLLTGVIGTNLAALSTAVEGHRAIAFCAMDNLCRGASGQALQNLNRALKLPEQLGLALPGLAPV